jgi:tetratricopeptide (TPR) repeat protein
LGALLWAGDFDSDESRRLTAAMSPLSLLLRAVARTARGERAAGWRDVQAAVEAAPQIGLVHVVASRLLYVLGDDRGALRESRAAVDLGGGHAAWLRCNQAREFGWYHEACAMLEMELRKGAGAARHARERAAGERFDQALEQLVRLYFDHHHDAAAAATLDRYLPLARGSVMLYLQAARVYQRQGDLERTLVAIRTALSAERVAVATRLEAAAILIDLGAFDEAVAIYESLLTEESGVRPALEALGRLHLWRGNTDSALHCADRLCALEPTSSAARRMRAAAMVLRGDYSAAVPILDAVLRDDPHDGEAYLWRAEASLRLGRESDVYADAERSLQHGYSFAACAIRMLATLTLGPGARSPSPRPRRAPLTGWLRRRPAEPEMHSSQPPARPDGALVHARHELMAEFTAMFADARERLAENDTAGLISLLDQSVVAMRGNRTPIGTWTRDDGTLARLPRSTSPRIVSRHALEMIRVATPDVSFRRLNKLAAQFPHSSMPLVHRGELQLWLGRYAEARADIEAAIAIERQTRWAWYGLAWLDLLAGDVERALATCASGIRVMMNSEGPVAYILRGEAFRLLGRLDEAREQLQLSCESHPTRLSAWINLALVHGAQGNRQAERATFRRIASVAPTLVAEAAAELGEDVFHAVVLDASAADASADAPAYEIIERILRHTLTMMRGNRASGLITYFTADGQLRHVPRHLGRVRGDADADAAELERLRSIVERAIAGR